MTQVRRNCSSGSDNGEARKEFPSLVLAGFKNPGTWNPRDIELLWEVMDPLYYWAAVPATERGKGRETFCSDRLEYSII